MSGTSPGPRPGSRRRISPEHDAVERILTHGPRREECDSRAQYETLRRMWAWEQSLRHGPKVADPLF